MSNVYVTGSKAFPLPLSLSRERESSRENDKDLCTHHPGLTNEITHGVRF